MLLRWFETSGTPVPALVEARLTELAGLGEPSGRGLRWRWEWAREGDAWVSMSMPGWCNGSAGYVFLWTLAHGRWTKLKKFLVLLYAEKFNQEIMFWRVKKCVHVLL